MVIVTIEDAQKNLAKLLSDVAAGEDVVIERNKVPVGRLVAPPTAGDLTKPAKRQGGRFAGRIQISDNFERLDVEFGSAEPNEDALAMLRDIAEMKKNMRETDGSHTIKMIREARDGGMYGA